MAAPTFHGTTEEADDLVAALARNCECTFTPVGIRMSTCAVHDALINDQRWLDGLLFARRLVSVLTREEWTE